MKNKFLLAICSAALLCSCSTAYKATQTPDDVYYSPASPAKERQSDYTYYDSDDRYLRMKVQHHALWSGIDDYSYWNDSRYDFGYSCTPSRYSMIHSFYTYYPGYGWGYGYTYGCGWNGWNSPHQTIVYYKNPQVYYGTNSKTNITAYGNNNYNNNNGSPFRRLFSNNNNGNRVFTTNNNPTRTFNSTPSNNAGGHSGGYNSSGSSASTPRSPRPPQQ